MFSPTQQNNQQQQSAFDTVNSILNSQNSSEQSPQAQSQKIYQLNTLCKDLIAANKHLTQQIDYLREQLDNKSTPSTLNVFNDQYSQMQLDFTDIEQNIKEYKTQLERYQKQITQQLKEKNDFIQKLKEDIEREKEKGKDQRRKIEELNNERQALIQTKNNLVLEIEELQTTVKSSKYESPRNIRKSNDYKQYGHSHHHSRSGSTFNVNVQQQLQKLIEKLVKELQHERYRIKKLNQENKRLQNSIVDLQREIMVKNNKIYELQITIIKNGKSNIGQTNNLTFSNRREQGSPTRGGHTKQPTNKLSRSMKNFTFMQLINEDIQITFKERLVIAMKAIDFYIRKIQNQDYSTHVLDAVSICNYTPVTPNLIMIKVDRSVQNFQGEYEHTQAEVAWNLAFMLDNLLNTDLIEQGKYFGDLEVQRDIADFLSQILENRGGSNLSTVFQLRKMVQEAIKCRK